MFVASFSYLNVCRHNAYTKKMQITKWKTWYVWVGRCKSVILIKVHGHIDIATSYKAQMSWLFIPADVPMHLHLTQTLHVSFYHCISDLINSSKNSMQ